MTKIDNKILSIIILNYNTKDLLGDCLDSREKIKEEIDFETIVVDNASSDGSGEFIKKNYSDIKLIQNDKNLGFASGNNRAKKHVNGKYILFLNSDTVVNHGVLKDTISYMQNHVDVGALTCKLVMPNGKMDPDSRRAFITPWIGLIHIFLKLDRVFPRSKLFAKYWYGYINEQIIHEVDVIQGAYFLSRKEVLDKVGWFDEDYFLDGEDIDLCWRIKEAGWKIIYYPKVSIIHIKGASKGKNKKAKISRGEKIKIRSTGVDSMEIFLRKRLWNKYPKYLIYLMIVGIRFVKIFRKFKTMVLG